MPLTKMHQIRMMRTIRVRQGEAAHMAGAHGMPSSMAQMAWSWFSSQMEPSTASTELANTSCEHDMVMGSSHRTDQAAWLFGKDLGGAKVTS